MTEATYSSEEFSTEKLELGVYTYTNVVCTSDTSYDNSFVELAGDWFIIDATDHCYYHFIFDNVGQFFALKTLIPDLKVLFRVTDPELFKKLPDYISWTIEKIKNEVDYVVLEIEQASEIKIERLHAVSTRLIPFFSILGIRHKHLITNDSYQDFVVPELRDFFFRHLPEISGPRKIYVSRKDKSEELRARSRYLEYLKANGVTWSPIDINKVQDWGKDDTLDPGNFIENRPDEFRPTIFTQPPRAQEVDIVNRSISAEDEDRLEQYFLDNGYTIFSHVDYDYPTQMAMVASCDYYVTFTGSSVLNSAVCKENANIYVLNHNTNWPMPNHEYTPLVVSKNAFNVFSGREYPLTVFSIDDIIEKLNEIGV
jgi:hypothetical protein